MTTSVAISKTVFKLTKMLIVHNLALLCVNLGHVYVKKKNVRKLEGVP